MLPNSREISLDTDMILKVGLKSSRIMEGYIMWFHKLLLMMFDP